jgi:hypothetical protein
MNILVVGDKASNIEELTKLGYEIVELDAKGEVISKKEPEEKKVKN